MKRITILLFTTSLLLTLAGCASEPTVGDKIKQHGEGATRLADDWNKGNELVIEGMELQEEGREDIDRGRKLIRQGEADVEKGEKLIEKGRRLKQESEAEFRKLSS